MSGDVLTTWGVVLDLDGERAGSASRCLAAGRAAYFERCPRLTGFLQVEGAAVRVTAEQVGPMARAGTGVHLRVGVSVIEVRPSSFDMAVRIRPLGDDADEPLNGRCTLVIERPATGERIPIPDEIRDEFIAIQLAARDLG